MTLQSQYNQFLKHNPDSTFSFNEWMKWHSHQMEQAIIQMMQDDEELGLYDYDWCKGKVVLPREEIKLEDVFNDDKKENIKKFIHEVKSIPKEEILANRCNAYQFIDFDKPLEESQNLKNFKKLVSDEVSPAMKEFIKEKETLEEVAEIWVNNRFTKQIKDEDIYASKSSIIESHILFAKWQQERMYSEEDVKNAFLDGWQLRDGDLPFPKAKKKWFNEFKKE